MLYSWRCTGQKWHDRRAQLLCFIDHLNLVRNESLESERQT